MKNVELSPVRIDSITELQLKGWGQHDPNQDKWYALVWVRKGAGDYFVDNEKHPLESNTVYCIAARQIHLLEPAAGCEGFVLSFDRNFINLKENNFDILFNTGLCCFSPCPRAVKINEDIIADMNQLIYKIILEIENVYLLKTEVVKGFLKIMLIYLCRQFEAGHHFGTRVKNMEVLRRFNELVETEFTSRKNVTQYAEKMHLTPGYLNTIVKKASGYSVSYHIHQRVVLEAKRRAFTEDSTMKEIAYHLGFNCTSHFSKFFKNVSGLNFSDFKRDLNRMPEQ
ncbi:MAG: helix-turn-helix domain-containing protein [Chitinophagaceae bacterium]